MKMSPDELEYAISQYLDGTLRPLEREALEERLAGDAQARSLLEEYRRLDAALKHELPAMPQVAWDRLSGEIQQTLAREDLPVRNYSIRSIGWIGRVAVAASVALVVGLGTYFASRPAPRPSPQAPQTVVAVVSGPSAEQSSGPVVAQISIGPSPALARNWRAGEEVVTRPTVVLIDRAHTSWQDGESNLY